MVPDLYTDIDFPAEVTVELKTDPTTKKIIGVRLIPRFLTARGQPTVAFVQAKDNAGNVLSSRTIVKSAVSGGDSYINSSKAVVPAYAAKKTAAAAAAANEATPTPEGKK